MTRYAFRLSAAAALAALTALSASTTHAASAKGPPKATFQFGELYINGKSVCTVGDHIYDVSIGSNDLLTNSAASTLVSTGVNGGLLSISLPFDYRVTDTQNDTFDDFFYNAWASLAFQTVDSGRMQFASVTSQSAAKDPPLTLNFSDYLQSYDKDKGKLKFTFNIEFPHCTVSVGGIYQIFSP